MFNHIEAKQVTEFEALATYVKGELKLAQSKMLMNAFTWF
jgi:hypothetical protein